VRVSLCRPSGSAGEALEALWPLYLAGALSLVLGWLIEREAFLALLGSFA
jgi:hypothetical protein